MKNFLKENWELLLFIATMVAFLYLTLILK
jgi:hypothetical protein